MNGYGTSGGGSDVKKEETEARVRTYDAQSSASRSTRFGSQRSGRRRRHKKKGLQVDIVRRIVNESDESMRLRVVDMIMKQDEHFIRQHVYPVLQSTQNAWPSATGSDAGVSVQSSQAGAFAPQSMPVQMTRLPPPTTTIGNMPPWATVAASGSMPAPPHTVRSVPMQVQGLFAYSENDQVGDEFLNKMRSALHDKWASLAHAFNEETRQRPDQIRKRCAELQTQYDFLIYINIQYPHMRQALGDVWRDILNTVDCNFARLFAPKLRVQGPSLPVITHLFQMALALDLDLDGRIAVKPLEPRKKSRRLIALRKTVGEEYDAPMSSLHTEYCIACFGHLSKKKYNDSINFGCQCGTMHATCFLSYVSRGNRHCPLCSSSLSVWFIHKENKKMIQDLSLNPKLGPTSCAACGDAFKRTDERYGHGCCGSTVAYHGQCLLMSKHQRISGDKLQKFVCPFHPHHHDASLCVTPNKGRETQPETVPGGAHLGLPPASAAAMAGAVVGPPSSDVPGWMVK